MPFFSFLKTLRRGGVYRAATSRIASRRAGAESLLEDVFRKPYKKPKMPRVR
jgi:hypothetical protein